MTMGLTGAVVDSAVNYQTPATGATITLNNNDFQLVLDPAGALAALTITMPATPTDGQIIFIRCVQAVTTFTINGNTGQTVKGFTNGATTSSLGLVATYKASNSTWYF